MVPHGAIWTSEGSSPAAATPRTARETAAWVKATERPSRAPFAALGAVSADPSCGPGLPIASADQLAGDFQHVEGLDHSIEDRGRV